MLEEDPVLHDSILSLLVDPPGLGILDWDLAMNKALEVELLMIVDHKVSWTPHEVRTPAILFVAIEVDDTIKVFSRWRVQICFGHHVVQSNSEDVTVPHEVQLGCTILVERDLTNKTALALTDDTVRVHLVLRVLLDYSPLFAQNSSFS